MISFGLKDWGVCKILLKPDQYPTINRAEAKLKNRENKRLRLVSNNFDFNFVFYQNIIYHLVSVSIK